MNFAPLMIALAIGVVIAMAVRHRRVRHQHAINSGRYANISALFVEWLSRLHKYGHDFKGQAANDAYVLYADPLQGIDSLERFWRIVRNDDAREQLISMFERHPHGPLRGLRAGERQYLRTGA